LRRFRRRVRTTETFGHREATVDHVPQRRNAFANDGKNPLLFPSRSG
jgi:hypothetical protein